MAAQMGGALLQFLRSMAGADAEGAGAFRPCTVAERFRVAGLALCRAEKLVKQESALDFIITEDQCIWCIW